MKLEAQPGKKGVAWPMWLALLACGCLLLSLVRLYASHFGALLFTMAVGPLSCAAAGLVLCYTGLPRQSEFRLLLGLIAVLLLSSALSEAFYGAFAENQSDLFVLVMLVFVCYALCASLPRERRVGVLNGLVDVSAAVTAAVTLIGVILASCGQYVRPAFLPEYGIGIGPENVVMGVDGRLVLFTHPNSSGMICEIVLLLNLYRILTDRRKAVRLLHGASALICYAALALAASRTATIAMAGGLGLYAFRLVFARPGGKGRLPRLLAAVAAAAATLAAAYLLNGLLADLLLSLSQNNAMSAAAATAAERDLLEDIGLFTGRVNIWRGALQAMCDTPRLFAIGTSPIRVGAAVSAYTPIYAQELHNSYLQMLLSGGVLCPLLFFAFLILLAVRSVKLYFAPGGTADGPTGAARALDAGFLPIPIAAILVNACMETFLLVYPQPVFASCWFFILAGYVICTARDASGGAGAILAGGEKVCA